MTAKSTSSDSVRESTQVSADAATVTLNLGVAAAARCVDRLFAARGYRSESVANGTLYTKGSNLGRLLSGGIFQRYRFLVRIDAGTNGAEVRVEKRLSVPVGGLVHLRAMTNELQALTKDLARLTKQSDSAKLRQ